ncbi:MAG: hypothetical protein ABJC74_03405 [Gemmatimonadota bacterium]
MAAIAIVMLAATLDCGNLFGPDVDGPAFADVKVNGNPWQVTRLTGLVPGTPGVGFLAEHVPSDSGQINLTLAVYVKNFHGPDEYPVGNDNDNQLVIVGLSSTGAHLTFAPASNDPGKLVVTEYRGSDSTIAGVFAARVHPMTVDQIPVMPDPFEISGRFRVRPN